VEDKWYEYFLHNQRGRLLAFRASGARYTFGERILVVIGEDQGIKRRTDSTLPIPANGEGGVGLH